MKNYIEKIAMNIVYQLDDDAKLPPSFRQKNNDKRINFVMKLIKEAIKEDRKKIKNIIKKMMIGERPNWKNGDPQWWDKCSEGYNQAIITIIKLCSGSSSG